MPAETFLVITIKDWEQSFEAFKKTPGGMMWQDAAMRPLREKFYATLQEDVFKPLEKEGKLQLTNYFELLKGQITFALTAPADETKGPGVLFIIDVKDKAEALKARLAEMTKRYSESGQQPKFEKLRDAEFVTFEFTEAAIDEVTGNLLAKEEDDEEEAKKRKVPFTIGQSQSLLIAARDPKDIEKVLARQAGGGVPALAEQGNFQKNQAAIFRESPAYAWMNFKPLYNQMMKAPAEQPEPGAPQNLAAGLTAAKVLPALGLQELESIALSATYGPEGYGMNLFVSAPEAGRQGLLKIIAPPAKDAGPPAFVPADAVKFSRVRLDILEGWNTLENSLAKIDTGMAGMVKMMMELAGKDKDPNFDLRKSLIASLGDDLITYEKAPRGTSWLEMENPPTITLVGARDPEQLLNGIKVILSLLPEPIAMAQMKEREFLGRKIYYISLQTFAAPGQPAVEREIQFANAGGYVAISPDRGMIEEFLRAAENPPKPLKDASGFADAAQKVGGLNTGWFGFENALESARTTFAAAKANPEEAVMPFGGPAGAAAQELFDMKLLPPFEAVAKYFHHAVYSVSSTPDGISVKFNMPRPPGL